MSGQRFKLASAAVAVLTVIGLIGASGASASASTGAAKTKTASVVRHQTVRSHKAKTRPQARRASLRAAAARDKRTAGPQAQGVLGSTNEALTVTRHVKKVKLHKPTKTVANVSTKKLKNGKASPALVAPLDAQFAGLDENNDDLDPLNVGDDFSADTDGAVGPHYYGEVVGGSLGFFDKATGALVDDDSLLNFFSGTGIGQPCDTANDDGFYEPHILYDSQSDRWIVMTSSSGDFDSVTGVGPTDECIGVSASGDPVNGDWYFYNVPLIGAGALDVYQSAAGIWTDGVYFAEVIGCQDAAAACPNYNSNEDVEGTEVWAFNRSDLESGAPLRVQTTQGNGGIGSGNFAGPRTTTTFSNLDADGLVPANLETVTGVPPAGRNEYFVSMSDLPGHTSTPLGDGLMDVWQYHVDWANPANSWVGQSASNQTDYQVTTPTYGVPDLNTGVLQTVAGPSTLSQALNTNYDYILPKPQYTDFGGVESLWTAHATATCSGSCNSSSTTGPDRIRWNQISLNSSDGSPVTAAAAQGQDYAPAPTTLNRWLPAVGVDKNGNMAVGYSGTNATTLASLYIAGRASSDPTSTLASLPETEVYAGDGYQTGATDLTDVADTGIGFFGPENSMSLDPNGCEMYFAGQVDVGSPTDPSGNDDAWATEVSAFHFPGCTPNTAATALSTSGDGDAATGTGTLTATLTATGTGSGVVGETVDFSLGGTAEGTAVTDSNGVATLSGVDTSTFAPGTTAGAVGATYAGDAAYNNGSSSATGALLVGTSQTISFGALSGQTYGGAPFTVSAAASSGLPVAFSASGSDAFGTADSGTCSVSGTTVTITGAGICTITATQSGNGTYLPAPPVSQTFTIAQESQTITPTGSWSTTTQAIGTNFKATATSSSGGQVFFNSDEVNCTEVDNGDTPQDEFVPLQPGTCTITAEQDGTTNIAGVTLAIPVTVAGPGNQTGTFPVTQASRRIDQLQNTPDDITWNSGLTDSTYTTSGTVSVASIAASTALTVAAAATPVAITHATEASTTVTITVGSNPFSTGNSVTIAGITPSGYNGTFTVTKPSGGAGNTTFTYTDTAGLTSPATSTTGATATLAGSGATESGNTVTITTTATNAGKMTAGDPVSVVGVGLAGYNGTFTVASVPTTTTFTYTDPTTGLAASGAGTVGDTAITGASDNAGTATLNLTAAPTVTINVGSSITVASVAVAGYNGTFTVTAVPTSKSVQYAVASGLAASGAGSITQPGTSCTASGPLGSKTLTALHAGSCTVTATQAGNANWNPGSVTKTYTITAGTQSVVWSPAGGNISATNPTSVSVTTNSGLAPGTVTSTTTSVCTVGSTSTVGGTGTVTVTPVAPGTCTLSAAGNSGSLDWSALTAKTQSFTVTNAGQAQTITFAAPNPMTLAESPSTLTATATSGDPVSFTSSTTSVCTATGTNGTTLTLLTIGTCTIVAAQAGDGTYAPATSVTRSFTVSTADQLIQFAQLPDVTFGVAPFAAGATSVNAYYLNEVSSGTPTGLAVSYTATGPCSVDGSGNVSVTGAGICTITASQAGSAIYNPAPSLGNQFTVNQAASSITFANPGTKAVGAPDFNPGATASDGEAVTYTATGTCTITGGGLVHLTGAGTCSVTAHSVGDANYTPPAAVTQTFTVSSGGSTTATGPTSATIVLGNTNTDVATVTGNASAGSPTGTVSFYACGPTLTPTACTSQAIPVGSAVGVTAGASNTSVATSPTFTPSAGGFWCFGAYYSGDTNYSASSDTGTDECFDVTTAASSTVTTPTSATIVLGTTNSDGATVTGNATGGSPTGTVSFFSCGPTLTPTACTSTANAVGGPVNVTAGGGNTATATSPTFTPTAGGFWCFGAYYSGDSNYGASTDTTTDECFDVTTAASSTVTTPTSATIGLGAANSDGATVTGNAAGGSPTGTVSFFECGPTVTAQPCTSTADPVGSPVNITAGAGDTATATSPTFTPNAGGFWCFAGYYSGDSNYNASTDTTADECFDVTTVGAAITTTPTHATIALGAGNTDGATVTGNAVAGSPTGTVSFYQCGPTATPQPCTSQANPVGGPVNLTGGPSNTATATSVSFTPNSGGYWCFGAYYSGDSNYNASTDTTTDECFGVPPVINSASSVTFTEGVAATPFQVTSVGGFAPVTYSETGPLPSGVTLSASGVLSGTPGFVAGSFPITLKATDAGGSVGTQSFTLFVTASSALHITTTSLPDAHKGIAYSTTLGAAGGKKPYKWTLASGTLPKGLKLHKGSGVISGTPSATATTETFSVTVTDKSHPKQTATATFTITVS